MLSDLLPFLLILSFEIIFIDYLKIFFGADKMPSSSNIELD